jgi:phosphoribosylformylglycinamidine (FGAM) synthase PurS component
MTPEQLQASVKQKQLQYYHMSHKRVHEKISSVCKSILANQSINKSHLQSFDNKAIE